MIDSNTTSKNEIAEHYNKREGLDLETRAQSRIYYLRNFNNWIKSVLISEFIGKLNNENKNQKPSVLDLGCGKGGDILKWRKANVSRVTFTDIAEKSLEECKRRNNEPFRSNFKSEFLHMDATTETIKELIKIENDLKHDLVSCQFVLHYSFETYEKANKFLENVSDALNTGGFFIGTSTNANEIVKRLRESPTDSFANDLYKIRFFQKDKENFDLFGVKFDFQLGFESDEVVNVPEYLMNFEVLVKLAERHNLKCIFKKTFADFFHENCEKENYKFLINIIRALEPVYSKNGTIDSEKLDSKEYETINAKLKDDEFKNDLNDDEQYMTLSKSEWEVINLYLVFAFEKVDDVKD